MGYPDSLKPWTYSLPHTAWLLKALRNVYAPSCSSCESCVAQKQSLVWLRPLSVGSQAPDCGTVDHSQAQALLRLSRASEPGSHTGNPPAPLHWLTNGLCENVATDVMSVHQAHVLPCRHVCCHAGTCVAMGLAQVSSCHTRRTQKTGCANPTLHLATAEAPSHCKPGTAPPAHAPLTRPPASRSSDAFARVVAISACCTGQFLVAAASPRPGSLR